MNRYITEKSIVDQIDDSQYKAGDVVSISFYGGGGNGACSITKITDTGFHYTVGGKRDKNVQYRDIRAIKKYNTVIAKYQYLQYVSLNERSKNM